VTCWSSGLTMKPLKVVWSAYLLLEKSAGKPVISSMIKKYEVDANILYGNIDRIKETPFGYLTLELTGPPNQLDEALSYLRSHGLELEVIQDV
jgi:D-methionine transport system ATP-binding protein